MEHHDLIFSGAHITLGDKTRLIDLAVKGETISALGAPGTLGTAEEIFDVSGKYIIPGAIDVHVHFREPGYSHKEDWYTGTQAAAMGGVTTIFEMPNTNPPTRSVIELNEKKALAEKACVDFGIYGLLAEDNLNEIEGLISGGANAFKCFMGNTFGNLPSPSTGAMLEGFEKIAKAGLRISLHAETASIMALRQKKLEEAGKNEPLNHLDARPEIVAIEAVSRAAVLAEWTGARIHVLHISSAGELRPLNEAKMRGVDITGETCPCYLYLDTSDYEKLGTIIRVNPPVRTKRDSEEIWKALKNGLIDMISTDHAPHTAAEKMKGSIWEADCGFPGVETQMPLMLTAVNQGKISLEHYVKISSENPARAFGLWPHKGTISVGAHADITVIDIHRKETIKAAKLHSRGKITPFENFETTGAPVHTLVRGRFVQKDRKICSNIKGHGTQVSDIQEMPSARPNNAEHAIENILTR